MRGTDQAIALQLLRDHPGWSDRQVADELDVPARTVGRWREDAGLAPRTLDVTAYPPPRVQGIYLECRHLVHPERVAAGVARCDYCGADRRAIA